VVVVLLLLLAGGGAAAYLALRRPGEAGAGVPRPQEPVARQDPPSPLAPPRADGGPPGPDGKAASQEPGKGDDREAGAGAPRPEGPAAEKGGPRKKVALARPDPARARALFEQAEERRKAMDAQGAIALYLKAERADPGLAEVHKKLGQCYQLVGDIPRARERYRRYLAAGPPDADRVRASLDLLR